MRRMLDPTKVGGGSTAPARHAYRIKNSYTYYYIVYSTKNYNFEIGKSNSITDFNTNDNYKELRTSGIYPANGFIKFSSPEGAYLSVMEVEIDASSSYPYAIRGLRSDNATFYTNNTESLKDVNIIRLF